MIPRHTVLLLSLLALAMGCGMALSNRVRSMPVSPADAVVLAPTPAASAELPIFAAAPPSPIVDAPEKVVSEKMAPLEVMPTTTAVDEKQPPVDPTAREALSYVGADPQAEEYWLAAINDPNLPEHERQDLIEDLNQDGLSDPKHPSLDDLPLIQSRLALIEQVSGDTLDQVNADAFEEAYKDLVELAMVATERLAR